jgi:hypothetical protein
MHSVRQIEVGALARHRHFGLAAKALGLTQHFGALDEVENR